MKTKYWHKELSNIGKAKIGTGCIIHSQVWIGNKVVIGKKVKIQSFAFIPDGITIEDNCFIGPGVVFTNDIKPPSKGKWWGKIIVQKGAVIGANVTILPNVVIGENSLIGAGSVVVHNVAPNSIYVGNPAIKIKPI